MSTNTESKKSFILHNDLREIIYNFSDKDLADFFRAILDFQNEFEIKLPSHLIPAFAFLKAQFVRNKEKYQYVLEKRSAAGIASGKARKVKRTKRTHVQSVEQNEQTGTKRTGSVSVSVSDSVNDLSSPIVEDKKSLIDLVSQKLWNDFSEMRKKIKKPMTGKAEELIIKDLLALENKQIGWAKVSLENSIKNNWQGVFEPKTQQVNKHIHNNFKEQDYNAGTTGFEVN